MSSPQGFRLSRVASVLLIGVLAGITGCTDAAGGGAGDGGESGAATAASEGVPGRLLDARDAEGHRYREVPKQGAPEVRIVLRPAAEEGWDLLLTVHHFRFSPARPLPNRPPMAAAGRGGAGLYLDGRRLAMLHGPHYHLASKLITRGTHQLTARLYADDSTVWAVDGKAVECTAALTASAA